MRGLVFVKGAGERVVPATGGGERCQLHPFTAGLGVPAPSPISAVCKLAPPLWGLWGQTLSKGTLCVPVLVSLVTDEHTLCGLVVILFFCHVALHT